MSYRHDRPEILDRRFHDLIPDASLSPALLLFSLFKSGPTHDVSHGARRAQPIRWPERMAESRLCNLRGNSARQAAPASGRVGHLEPNRDSPGRWLLPVHAFPRRPILAPGLNKSFSREPVQIELHSHLAGKSVHRVAPFCRVFIFATAGFKLHFGWGYFSCASAGEWSLLRLFAFQLRQLHSLLTRLSDMSLRSTCSRQWRASAAR